MRIFLDTEFTQLDLNDAKLISLGLVVEKSLEELYIEVSPLPPIGECSAFVHDTVLPLLGRYPNAKCPQGELRNRIINWLQLMRHPDDELFIHFDSEFDERMIREALDPVPNWLQIARISSRDTNELLRQEYHAKDKVGRPEHHALHDAHALAYSYRPRSATADFFNPLAL